MTAQIGDTVIYKQKKYEIVAIQNIWPFNPEEHLGIKPVAVASHCWRGYFCDYSVSTRGLKLKNISIGLDENVRVNGVESKFERDGMSFFSNVNIPIQYSGGIVIARNFIPSFYVHMGYQAPYAFETVYELILENGKLINIIDQSDQMKQIRETNENIEPPTNLVEFIASSFSLNYTDKWI